jgi:acyl dehydratase
MKVIADLTFDDLESGDRFDLGVCPVTREDVLDFASRYDPQPQHLDDDGGVDNPLFDRLAASGWHTASLMNQVVGPLFKRTRIVGLAGAGIEELRWLRPVYAGESLEVTLEILSARPSRSNPDRGLINMLVEARNDAKQLVSFYKLTGVFERSPRAPHSTT